jgi:predicted NBD/HSP70 family sugar kinase
VLGRPRYLVLGALRCCCSWRSTSSWCLADLLTADGLLAAYRRRRGGGEARSGKLFGLALAGLAVGGDRVATEVFDAAGKVLGHLLLRVGALLDPSLVVVGGGLPGARELLAPGMAETIGVSAGEGGRL